MTHDKVILCAFVAALFIFMGGYIWGYRDGYRDR